MNDDLTNDQKKRRRENLLLIIEDIDNYDINDIDMVADSLIEDILNCDDSEIDQFNIKDK